jgi:hypothetical protein
VNDRWRFIDDGPDVLQRNHRISGIPEPFGRMLDAVDVIFQVFPVGCNQRRIHVWTHIRGYPEGAPQMRFTGADLEKASTGRAGRAHEQPEAGRATLERVQNFVPDRFGFVNQE